MDRATSFLELAHHNSQRFHELETLQWRINFSVWAFVGAIAYLRAQGLSLPTSIVSGHTILYGSIVIFVFHFVGLLLLSWQQDRQRRLARMWRREAQGILNGPSEPSETTARRSELVRSGVWVVWQLGVSVVLLCVVALLIQYGCVVPKT